MNNIEYYKSLVSDEEVIKALIKDSKAREGELIKEKTRVRPNLNFFQRTVTNLVSSNKRIATKQEDVVSREYKKITRKIKTPHTLMREIILANKTHFVKSKEQSSTNLKSLQKYIEKKKHKISELKQEQSELNNLPEKNLNNTLNLHLNKRKFLCKKLTSEDACTSIDRDLPENNKWIRRSSDSSDISIVSISSSEPNTPDNIIELSDSDSDSSENERTYTKGKNSFEQTNKNVTKKRKRKKDS